MSAIQQGASSAKRWTAADDATLRAAYCRGGAAVARKALPGRSASAIYMRAIKLKLRSPRQKKTREVWPHLPPLDAEIRAAAARQAGRGCWTAIAARWKRPQWYVSRRAADLGLSLPRGHIGEWSEAEIELLHATADSTAAHAARTFKRRGFARTACAIQHKRWMVGTERGTGGMHSANGLAEMLGVGSTTIAKAIKSGALRATRDSGHIAMQLIRERDIRDWLLANPCAIDLHRMPSANQPWLISVLCGQFAHD